MKPIFAATFFIMSCLPAVASESYLQQAQVIVDQINAFEKTLPKRVLHEHITDHKSPTYKQILEIQKAAVMVVAIEATRTESNKPVSETSLQTELMAGKN
jgi:hypothetical protein